MNHIFISYSTQNAAYARRLADKLREEGFDVWLDNRRLHSSEDWWRSIVLALRECTACVVILSPESDASRWVQREITLAEKYGKPIFPLLLAGDLNTPNWELFVRTQVENVRDGSLPPANFYDFLASYAPRSERRGADVTDKTLPPPVDAETRAEIAAPPPQAEMSPTAVATPSPRRYSLPEDLIFRHMAEPAVATRARRGRWPLRRGLMVGGGGLIALVVAVLLIANGGNGRLGAATPTSTWTPTPTATRPLGSTFTPVSSEVWQTVTAFAQFMATPAPTRTFRGVVYSTGTVNLRTGPGTSYPVAGTLTNDSDVTIFAKANGWFLVELSAGNFAWINATLVIPDTSQLYIPTAVTVPAPPA